MSAVNDLSNDELTEIKEIFAHFDTNRNGVIEASEFGALVEALDAGMDYAQVQMGLSIVDADGNGTVEWVEFLHWWAETRTA